jgi:hypothetical protein
MAESRPVAQTNLMFGGIDHFAIQVDDVEEDVATLRSIAVEIVVPPEAVRKVGGDRFAFIYRNERMLVEPFQPA